MRISDFSADRAFALVDTAAICRNFCLVRRHLKQQSSAARIIAVVKTNAYGHGLLPVSAALARAGCDFFAVATAKEALALRAVCPRADILILGYTPPQEAPLLARAHILQAVFSVPYAVALSKALDKASLGIHLKIDGGLCREGFDASDKRGMLSAIRQKNLHLQGVFTHFPAADTDPVGTRAALNNFLACRKELQAPFAHAAASAALLTVPESVLDGARAGLLLYGISPVKTTLPLRPALSLFAPIQQIRSVKKGTPIGYGGDFVTARESRIGTLPIGYGDGLCRRMTGAPVTLLHRGKRFSVPICGRISMDMTTVDLTDTPARVGDNVCLFESAADPAAEIGSIPYEVLTALSARVERQYI